MIGIVQILLYLEEHESIIVEICGEECQSYEYVHG